MKKLVSLVLVLAMVSTLLVGCQSSKANTSKPGEKVKISFIDGFTGGDGPFMKKIIDGFNASQDKYEVVQLSTADEYTKFKSDNYDMLVIHADLISTFHADGLLREVSDIYKNAGLSLDKDFHPVTKEFSKYDDGVFAFPLDVYADTMYYNKDLVKDVPKTYADILSLKTKLDSEKTGIYPIAIPLSGDHDWLMMAMLTQCGVNFVQDGHLKLDTDEAANALLKLNKMIYQDKVSATKMAANDDINAFLKKSAGDTNVQAALSLTGPWNYTSAKATWGDKLGIAPFPTLGDNLQVPAGGHNFAVSAKVKDPDKIAGITAFIKYVYQPNVLLNWADSGQAPVHLPTMEVVKASPDKYPVAAVNYTILDKTRILPPVYNIREQVKYLYTTVWQLVYGKENLTKDQLMVELKNATQTATELSKR